MSKLIMIDPGHGGFDPGAVSGKRTESVYALNVAKALAAKLRKAGVDVALTRDSDTTVGKDNDRSKTLVARVKMAKERKADLFLSIHFNSASVTTASGTEVYVWDPTPDTGNVAHNLVRAVGVTLGFHGEPVKKGDFYVIRNNDKAMLLEMTYINNPVAMHDFDENFDKIINDMAAVLIPYALGGSGAAKPKQQTDYENHQFTNEIKQAMNAKVMTAYNGMFRPNDPVTRGEMAAILSRLGLLDNGDKG